MRHRSRCGEQHVLVVAQTAGSLLIDLGDLLGGLLQHMEPGHLHRRHRRIDEEDLRHQLVDLLEVLDHPVELELGGGNLAFHQRHPQVKAVERLRLGQGPDDDLLLILGHLSLGGLNGPRRTHLPTGHLRLHALLPREHDVLHARHRDLDLLLDQNSSHDVRYAEGEHSEERAPPIAEGVSKIKPEPHAEAQDGGENEGQHMLTVRCRS